MYCDTAHGCFLRGLPLLCLATQCGHGALHSELESLHTSYRVLNTTIYFKRETVSEAGPRGETWRENHSFQLWGVVLGPGSELTT